MRIPFFQHLSAPPTNPRTETRPRGFDVADLYAGPVAVGDAAGAAELPLDEKLRQAYFWIVNTAIISPHYDIEYQRRARRRRSRSATRKSRLTLPSGAELLELRAAAAADLRDAAQVPVRRRARAAARPPARS